MLGCGFVSFYRPPMNLQEFSSITDALDIIDCPAIWLDRRGSVLSVSGKASTFLDSEFYLRGQRLYVADQSSRLQLDALLEHVRLVPDQREAATLQVVINRSNRRPIVLDAIVQDWASSSPPCQIGALLLLRNLDEVPALSRTSLMNVFGLTPVQAQLASLLVGGLSLTDIAREMNISSGTARNHLKAVFVRTATRRQAELVSLLSRLR